MYQWNRQANSERIRTAVITHTECLTHCPTVDSHPTILDCTQAWERILAPRRTVVLDRHTPVVEGGGVQERREGRRDKEGEGKRERETEGKESKQLCQKHTAIYTCINQS